MNERVSATLPNRVGEQLREAATFRLLGLLLERPRVGWVEEVDLLAREITEADVKEAARAARAATEGDYLAAFGPGGFASPREVAYRTMEDPSRLLSDLSAWYEAFAFAPRAEDPADHVAVETGFAGYLLLKEAMARLADDEEAAVTTSLSRERFVAERLRPFVEGLSVRMHGAGGHLERALSALRRRVEV